jgi:hypothetical protein
MFRGEDSEGALQGGPYMDGKQSKPLAIFFVGLIQYLPLPPISLRKL